MSLWDSYGMNRIGNYPQWKSWKIKRSFKPIKGGGNEVNNNAFCLFFFCPDIILIRCLKGLKSQKAIFLWKFKRGSQLVSQSVANFFSRHIFNVQKIPRAEILKCLLSYFPNSPLFARLIHAIDLPFNLYLLSFIIYHLGKG